MDIICTIDFISVSVSTYWVLVVIFSFNTNCLGEVCGDSKMYGIQGCCYKRPSKQVHQSGMDLSITNSCSISYNRSCWSSLWTYISRGRHFDYILVCLLIADSILLHQGLSHCAKMEPNATPPSQCSGQREAWKQVCLHDFLVGGFLCSVGFTKPRCLSPSKSSAVFPPGFHNTMGRNNISVKLFVQPTIVLVYKNRRLRTASLELLRCRHRTPARRSGGHRQRRCSVASLDV